MVFIGETDKQIAMFFLYLKIIPANVEEIEKRYVNMAGNVGILAATDIVYIHHDGSFKLNTPAFLKMRIRPIQYEEKSDVCSIHVDEQGVFTMEPMEHEVEIVGMFITLPVIHFTG